MPRSVSIANTVSPADRWRRSAMSFGNVALIEPPAWRSFSPRVMCPPEKRNISDNGSVAHKCYHMRRSPDQRIEQTHFARAPGASMGPAGLRGSSKERLQRGPTGADKQRVRTWEACPEDLEPAVVGSGAALDLDRRDGTSAHGHEVDLGGAVAPVAHLAAGALRDGEKMRPHRGLDDPAPEGAV